MVYGIWEVLGGIWIWDFLLGHWDLVANVIARERSDRSNPRRLLHCVRNDTSGGNIAPYCLNHN